MIRRQGPAGRDRRPRQQRLGALLACWGAVTISAMAAAQEAPPDPVAAEIGLQRGILEFERGRFDAALGHLEAADAAGAGAAYYRGLSLLALRRADEALRQFEAVRRRPGAPAEAELDAGVAQLVAGDAAGAEATLTRFVGEHSGDPYGHYFLGVALFRQKRYGEAELQFQMAATDASLAPYLDFYQGLSSYARGDARFRASLASYRPSAGPGPAADLARRLAAAPTPAALPPLPPHQGEAAAPAPAAVPEGWGRPAAGSADPDRRWNLAVLTGYEYDSNVSLAPGLVGLGSAFQREDPRWTLANFGEYRLVQREDLVLGLIESTYHTFQFGQDEFNVQDYMGGAYANAAVGDFILGARYEFHETLLDSDQFATSHRFTPNFTWREGDFGHLTAYYEYEKLDVSRFALVPAQVRTGAVHSVGLTQAVYLFGGAGRLYLGYRFDDANTLGTDFDRRTNMITARVEVPLPGRIVADAEVRQFWDDYANPNSLDFFGRPRFDQRVEVRVGLQRFITSHVSVRVDYTFFDNNSNVENLFGASFYEYDRHILSTVLIYDF